MAAKFVGQEVDKGDCTACERRQRTVNWVGRLIGIGGKSEEIRRVLSLEQSQQFPVHKCGVHGRCLPSFPGDLAKWREQPEAQIYPACAACPDFDPAAFK